MQEIAQEDFPIVAPLLKGGYPPPEIISILEHNNPGWIFVDQVIHPTSALVWSKGIQGFYLIGDHTNEYFIHNLDDFIKRIIEPRMKEFSIKNFEVSGHHNTWNLESIFSTRKLYTFEQLVYQFLKKPQIIDNKIETINLKAYDWQKQRFQNIELINRHLALFWASLEDFKEKGFGYAAIKDQEVIGVCYSSFATHNTHAIGVETVTSFQNKGVGMKLASLLVEEIKRNGFTPYWDCSFNNKPSIKLAERLGFTLMHRYICSGFQVD